MILEMKSSVKALWEHMNQGFSSKTQMSFLSTSRPKVNKASSKMSNVSILSFSFILSLLFLHLEYELCCFELHFSFGKKKNWITYLGLAPKETGLPGQDPLQSDESKNIAATWEEMNKGVPKSTFKSFSSQPSSAVTKTSETVSNVRNFHTGDMIYFSGART